MLSILMKQVAHRHLGRSSCRETWNVVGKNEIVLINFMLKKHENNMESVSAVNI